VGSYLDKLQQYLEGVEPPPPPPPPPSSASGAGAGAGAGAGGWCQSGGDDSAFAYAEEDQASVERDSIDAADDDDEEEEDGQGGGELSLQQIASMG
jgi:hypothetical protein